jgi:ribosome-associated toxin RatA of RatAB toxin-antitoxin module
LQLGPARIAPAVCALAALLCAWHTTAAPVDRISVEAHREGEAVLVEAKASVRADVRVAWQVLTAYDRYTEFIPELKSSRILARSGATAIVEQKGEAGFFFFHFPLEVVFAVTEQAPAGVTSRAISGTFREMTSAYELAEEGDRVRLTYHGRLVPAFRLPPLVGVPALRSAMEKQFTELVQEIGRRAAIEREDEKAPQ